MVKKITHKLKFINSFRFMPTSLSDLVDSFSETNKEKYKAWLNGKYIKSECDLIGHENNNLCFKCEKRERIWLILSLSCIVNSISEISKNECKACMKKKDEIRM